MGVGGGRGGGRWGGGGRGGDFVHKLSKGAQCPYFVFPNTC